MLHSVTIHLPSDDFATADVTYRSDPSLVDVMERLPRRLEPTYRTVTRRLGPDYPRFVPARVEW